MKPLRKVNIKWCPDFAYAIGLIVTDGCLSGDGRHIELSSKDEEIIENFRKCLGIDNKIGRKAREKSADKRYYRIQFGDINFYNFLLSIGLEPAKSRTIGRLRIPAEYFRDFLRGCLDGDGNINIQRHPESMHPQLRVRITSASKKFLIWLKVEIANNTDIKGGWIRPVIRAHELSYGKSDSVILLSYIYYDVQVRCLKRKYLRAKPFLV
jgi:hypothetical protein